MVAVRRIEKAEYQGMGGSAEGAELKSLKGPRSDAEGRGNEVASVLEFGGFVLREVSHDGFRVCASVERALGLLERIAVDLNGQSRKGRGRNCVELPLTASFLMVINDLQYAGTYNSSRPETAAIIAEIGAACDHLLRYMLRPKPAELMLAQQGIKRAGRALINWHTATKEA